MSVCRGFYRLSRMLNLVDDAREFLLNDSLENGHLIGGRSLGEVFPPDRCQRLFL